MPLLRPKPIRTVTPASLHTVEGWNDALRAVRPTLPAGPCWQRGDVAMPIETAAGTLFGFADTWVLSGGGDTFMSRNSYLLVDPTGLVSWLRPDGTPGPTAPTITLPAGFSGTAPGAWWWPMGGVSMSAGRVLLWGEIWEPGPGFGHLAGPAAILLEGLGTPAVTVTGPVMVGLDLSLRWGEPMVTAEGLLHTVGAPMGYDPATWRYELAVAPLDDLDSLADPGSWDVVPVTFEQGPLDRPRLMSWRGGVLASAKVLSSAPGLGYQETPEVAAWWCEDAAGPYRRLPDLHPDTTRPGWPSYSAGAAWLPHMGLVVQWSRNGEADVPYDVDSYGPTLATPRIPSWAETAVPA